MSPKPSDNHFTISNLISRFRSKRKTKRAVCIPNKAQDVIQDSRPPLIVTPLPLVLSEHQESLSRLGWTTISIPDSIPGDESKGSSDMLPVPGPHPLQAAYEALFAASQAFFAQPEADKQKWKHKLGSEEGWSSIRGEKEFITLRTLEYCPEILRGPAQRFWNLMGAHLSTTLGRIGTTLGLPENEDESKGLRQFLGPCARMPESDATKTATMIRLFRYEGWEAKEVAEPHADLGLLSVVVGNVPGLEVWDGSTWFECEREMHSAGRKGAIMLAGRQLERLSNGRYPAGGHRVVSYGRLPGPSSPSTVSASAPVEEKTRYRFSIVFVLRAHEPVLINSADFETEIVGTWPEPMRGVTAGKFYEQIRSRHFNINIDVEEREKQRRKIRGM
ncbi:hypothetical protein LEMA_P108110.1 [Plenodomus lingam JN3]|uniref:Fe2OG dioxygenase domain-containing protein n=2 Tax=Leptosphaeria maculans TaxID=5022 RepID=E4ZYM0_LEPMJ|nr:hypothetical protein LEMA_P108110.1 [Plenodomus lingam JN3]CBX96546.1 hypothetical protein LEMA_P108110.1 [Plenodomus lingam JN3]